METMTNYDMTPRSPPLISMWPPSLYSRRSSSSGVGRTQSMASSSLREYRNLFVEAANFLPQADASTHPPTHRESVLRCWPQAASLETDSLRVPLVPRSRNRGWHSFPIQALDWRWSKAALQL